MKKLNSLYIHIPFCQKKCLYCSFVVSIGQEKRVDDYINALEKEMYQHDAANLKTIYIGGGTPTYLNCDQLQRTFDVIKQKFVFDKDIEITIESNPEGLDLKKLKLLKTLGVNRISLGIQSLNDERLKLLGRVHDKQKALDAFNALREAGFNNINVDMMFAFPNQTQQDLESDLKEMICLGSEHVSIYALTIEKNSQFFAKKVRLDEESTQADQYVFVRDFLEQHGFAQYEVSNFAKQGFESLHNINYWTGGNYLGIGVGAHAHMDGRRSWNVSKLMEYLKCLDGDGSPQEGFEDLSKDEQFIESILFGLRMNRGIVISEYEKCYGCKLSEGRAKVVEQLVQENFLQYNDGFLQTTRQGQLVLDTISAQLI